MVKLRVLLARMEAKPSKEDRYWATSSRGTASRGSRTPPQPVRPAHRQGVHLAIFDELSPARRPHLFHLPGPLAAALTAKLPNFFRLRR